MKTIAKEITNLIEIKKSKFISYAFSVNSEDETKEILKKLKKEHSSATHICYAYVIYSPSLEKCSDDGEPSGTAGKPILDILKRNNLSNVFVAVVRYFGGIKLGAGGLVHAYSNSAKEVIELSEIKEMKEHYILDVEISVDNKYLIDNNSQYKIISINYDNIANKILKYTIAVEVDSEDYNKLNNFSKSQKIIENIMM